MRAIPGLLYAYEQADALAGLLDAKGFSTTVYTNDGHAENPCVKVESGRWGLIDRTEYVYLAPADNGEWWFWWPWVEPINAAEEVSIVADKVARSIAGITRPAPRVL